MSGCFTITDGQYDIIITDTVNSRIVHHCACKRFFEYLNGAPLLSELPLQYTQRQCKWQHCNIVDVTLVK